MHQRKFFFRHFLSCKRGFSLIETSIVLAIAGCFLTAIIYQGNNMMEKAFTQKIQKEIVQCALHINQWKSNPFNENTWEELSESGMDPKNVGIWEKAVHEGALSSKQISTKHKVPSIGNGAYLSAIRDRQKVLLVVGAINGQKTDGPIFTPESAQRLSKALQESGLSAEIKGNALEKHHLLITIE